MDLSKNTAFLKTYSLIAIGVALFMLFVFPTQNNVCAGPASAPSSCDPVYMESLESRAWLEGEREIIQNQNYIVKPDSVLEYTCWDRALIDVTAGPIAAIFSDEWRGVTAPPPMLAQLEASVLPHAIGYLGANFLHEFGGGTWVGSGGAAPFSASGNPCTVMRDTWFLAKSENFIPDPAIDGFYTFFEYIGMPDPRIYPTPSPGPGAEAWIENMLIGYNIESLLGRPPNDFPDGYPFRDPLEIDFIELIRPRLIPGVCTPPVPTGVTVFTSAPAGEEGYPDGICTNPGCTYVGEACI